MKREKRGGVPSSSPLSGSSSALLGEDMMAQGIRLSPLCLLANRAAHAAAPVNEAAQDDRGGLLGERGSLAAVRQPRFRGGFGGGMAFANKYLT